MAKNVLFIAYAYRSSPKPVIKNRHRNKESIIFFMHLTKWLNAAT